MKERILLGAPALPVISQKMIFYALRDHVHHVTYNA